ncbi:MAG: methyltransferase domain-containing protein [Acidobacteria bacterium]|nr:methyltransferase domain-containing protein [Acidobacteriota bacterium]
MNLHDLQRHWDAFGEQDPMWAILTDPARKGRRWTAEEFFATGIAEIEALMAEARGFGLPTGRRRALDFGCGLGRLTQALADHCDAALGLDVAPSMIAQAATFNRHGARVQYRVQTAPPFHQISSRSMDVVYTGRVLQHIAPVYAREYIRELARVLAPGGFLSFDVPSRWLDAPVLPAGALPIGAYRAALAARLDAATDTSRVVVEVTVTNAGTDAWPAGTPLNLGNHWLTRDGAVVVADDRRVAVPLPLAPGASATVTFQAPRSTVQAADVLELDLVHEGVAWFAWHGSPTVRLDVGPAGATATAAERPAVPATPAPGPAFEPVMEMHAVPREDVEALLGAAGVRLLRVRAEAHCGPRWEAFRYDVTADSAR